MAAYSRMQRGNDTAFSFEQEANFWYLTGIEEPDWTVIVDTTANTSWLIAPKVGDTHVLFDGELAPETAARISGINKVLNAEDGDALLRQLAKKHSVVYTVDQPQYSEHFNFSLNPSIRHTMARLDRIFSAVQDCSKEIAMLRAIKEPEEIEAIQRAVNLTVKAFEMVKANRERYRHEYEIEADFTHMFLRKGAVGHAYDPIIAAGKNACMLHYTKNNARLEKRQLILMDVGARMDGYAADITRSYAFGEITDRQKEVHKAVVGAQKECIKLLGPGVGVEEYSKKVDEIMRQTARVLGLLKTADEKEFRLYFPHAISHGLGVDVHDRLGAPRSLLPGMVLTVEPGIYIPKEKIGVRIEDDILITEKGVHNLSGKLSTDW